MSTPATTPRRRGPAPSLDPDDVVAATLDLLDRHGETGLSIRVLAEVLGVSAMTIYNYVPTKARLLEMAVDSVIDRVALPEPDAADWEEELRRYALEAWDAQVPHPWVPTLLASRKMADRPTETQARAALLQLFERAGADSDAAREGVAVFFSFMIGSLVQVAPAVADHGPTLRSRAVFEHAFDIIIDGLRCRFGVLDGDAPRRPRPPRRRSGG